MSRPTRLRRDSRHSRLALEPLEDRRLLDASVSIADVVPSLRNESPEEIVFQFSEPVTGFDVDDVRLIHDGGSVDLSNLVLVSTDGGQTYTLGDISTLPTGGGAYWLGLDVANAGIVDLANGDPLSIDGIGLGPELIVNGSFDAAGGGSDDLSGWSFANGGVIWQEEAPGDGVARVTSNHAGTLIDPNMPDGAPAAKIRQGITTIPLTTYQIEFDLVTRQVVTEISSTDIRLQVFKGDPRTSLLFQETYDKSHNGHQVLEFATEPDDLGITLQFIASRSNRDFTVDNVSVREVIVGPSVQWTVDTTMPTVSILPVSPSPRNSRVEDLTIAFNEPIVGFDLSDLILTRDSGDGPQTVSMAQIAQLSTSDNTTFLLGNLSSLTGADGAYQLSLDPVDSLIQDLATNELGGGDQQAWVMDRVAPNVSVDLQLDEGDRTPALTGTVDDPNATIAVTVAGNTYAAVNRGDGTWILPDDTIDPLLIDGTYDVLATATDAAGNVATDDTTGELVIDGPPIVFQVTASFQDGVFPTPDYAGTRDAPIFASDADVNFGDAVTLRADAEQSSTGQPAWALFKWDLSSIPVGATVDEVSLTVNVTNITVAPGFHLFEVKTPWLESAVTWNGPDANSTWEDPGLTDPIDAGEAILGTLPGTALGPLTISLTAEGLDLVHRWISDPSTNHGFLLSNPDNTNSVRFDSREGTTPADRPKLSIDFDFIDTEPPTAALTFPADNGPADQDDDAGEVRVGLRDRIEVQLSDYALDDATVTAETVALTKDGQPVPDVAFSFDAATDLITLTPAVAPFPAGDYLVILNDAVAKIADDAGNQLPRTVFSIQFDDTLPTTPIARDDIYETDEDTPLAVAAEQGVLSNDDGGNNAQLIAVLVQPPENGTVELNEDGSFTYTPAANYNGSDHFTYRGEGLATLSSDIATVTIAVLSVEDAPIAIDDFYVTLPKTVLVIDLPGVISNDFDPEDDPLTAALVSEPLRGTLSFDPNGSFQYTPADDFVGQDRFTYRLISANGNSNPATVTIDVTGYSQVVLSDRPSAYWRLDDLKSNDGAVAVEARAGRNGTYVGDVELVPHPGLGTAARLNGENGFIQIPDSNAFDLRDRLTIEAWINRNGAPEKETERIVDRDFSRGFALAIVPSIEADAGRLVLWLDGVRLVGHTDVSDGQWHHVAATWDGQAMRLYVDGRLDVEKPLFGRLSNAFGPLGIGVNLSDQPNRQQFEGMIDEVALYGDALSEIRLLRHFLAGFRNIAARDEQYDTPFGTAISVGVENGVLANDAQFNVAPLSVSPVDLPKDGALTLNADGSFEYVPADGFSGTDTFTYIASDGVDDSNVATVSIIVRPETQVRGVVFSDALADGVRNVTDGVVPGTVVELIATGPDGERGGNDDAPRGITLTDESGRYFFGDTPSGRYYLSFRSPTDLLFSPRDRGNDDLIDSDVDMATGLSDVFLVQNGSQILRDAGLIPSTVFAFTPAPFGTISTFQPARPDMAIDPSGNIYVIGISSGVGDFDPGPGTRELSGMYVAKYSAVGELVWAEPLSGLPQSMSIAVDSERNVLITAYAADTGAQFLQKFDSEGRSLWTLPLTSSFNSRNIGIAVDGEDNVLAAGHFRGTFDFDPSPRTFELTADSTDAVVAKYDRNGEFSWATQFTGSEEIFATSVDVDPMGNVLVTGHFIGIASFGRFSLGAQFRLSGFVAKLSNEGDVIWASGFRNPNGFPFNNITVDQIGNAIVTGEFRDSIRFLDAAQTELTANGEQDVFVAKFDVEGNLQWAHSFGSELRDESRSDAVVDQAGNVVFAMAFAETIDVNPGTDEYQIVGNPNSGNIARPALYSNPALISLDSSGRLIWARRIESRGRTLAHTIAVDGVGDIAVLGMFYDTVELDLGLAAGNPAVLDDARIYFAKFHRPEPLVDITGRIYEDIDGDGQFDIGEPVFPDVTVYIDRNANGLFDMGEPSALTGETGRYRFSKTRAGAIPLRIDLDDADLGSKQGIEPPRNGDTVLIATGQIDTVTRHFVYTMPAAVGNFVWNDLNHNGIQDAGEAGISGVRVRLVESVDGVAGNEDDRAVGDEQFTDDDGMYTFENLAPGNYFVEFMLPDGFLFTAPLQGDDESIDSDAKSTDGRTSVFALAAGQNDIERDAGLFRSGTIRAALTAVRDPSASDRIDTIPESLHQVSAGSTYIVEIWVQDVEFPIAGVAGGSVDLSYTTAPADVVGLSHGQTFNLLPSGSVDDGVGLVDDFGGGSFSANVGVAPQWARLGYVEVLATGAGEVTFSLDRGALEFSRFGQGFVDWDRVNLSDTITVQQVGSTVRLEAVLVRAPSETDAGGEIAAVPASAAFLHEWEAFWVEVWGSTPAGSDAGIAAATFDLVYNTDVATATRIEYGPAFGAGQSGAIDDATGIVSDIGASATRGDVGDDRPVLLARVLFEPTANDQAAVDAVGHRVGPYDLGIRLTNIRTAATTTEIGPAPQTELWAVIYDVDDSDAVNFGDFSFFAAAFELTVGDAEPPLIWWADFDKSGLVDFGDFSFFTANLLADKNSGAVTFPDNYPEAWRPGAPAPGQAPAAAAAAAGDLEVQLVARLSLGADDTLAALPDSLSAVSDAQTYFVEVWIRDDAPDAPGITGGRVDLLYTTDAADVLTATSSDQYNVFVSSSVDEPAGLVRGLGGGTFDAGVASGDQWARLGYVQLTATGDGPIRFTLSPGDLQLSRFGEGNIPWDEVSLGSLSLNSTPADLTGNGFVDFQDLTILLANWNQDVSAAEGNLVDAGGTPVNFQDLTVLLAAWTGPGAAASPQAATAAAVGGGSVGDGGKVDSLVAVGDASYRRRDEAPRQATAYGSRRRALRSRPAGGIDGRIGRLQAAAVDRVLSEEVTRREVIFARRGRRQP